MKGLEKGHQCGGLRRVQVFPIGRHITAALEYLAHDLIAGQTYSDRVERRPSLAAAFTEGMAVVTLFRLEDKRPLDLKRRSSAYEFRRDGSSGPSVHNRTPRRMAGQIGERSECHSDQ